MDDDNNGEPPYQSRRKPLVGRAGTPNLYHLVCPNPHHHRVPTAAALHCCCCCHFVARYSTYTDPFDGSSKQGPELTLIPEVGKPAKVDVQNVYVGKVRGAGPGWSRQ
jgi:hypothetical protein